MIKMKAPMLVCLLALSGCYETEQSCYDRLVDELNIKFRTAQRLLEDPDITVSKRADWVLRQGIILEQRTRLIQLHASESVSVCEFYLDGIKLIHK